LESNKKTILSTREVEVLGLVSKGFASKEIADKLFLSINTVNNHRQNILEKVRASNTSEAGQLCKEFRVTMRVYFIILTFNNLYILNQARSYMVVCELVTLWAKSLYIDQNMSKFRLKTKSNLVQAKFEAYTGLFQ